MEIDKTTLNDISIFNAEEDLSVFNKLNLCNTLNGKEQLYYNFTTPLNSVDQIQGVQKTVQLLINKSAFLPTIISNGTIMVVEKFFTATLDEIPESGSAFQTFNYKVFHGPDYSLVKYSVQHCFDFIKGMKEWVSVLLDENTPLPLKEILESANKALQKTQFANTQKYATGKDLPNGELLQLAHFIRYKYKINMLDLLATHVLQVQGLYHLLLATPVNYNVELNEAVNFLFLTGANMAGKSTFIKSVGSAVFLAHTGMAVPATQMKLTYFDGLLSNINVVDNLVKGESYFYNEVQRIKATIAKISNEKKWLILIDELFKGTNVQDAMKCSATVIEGLHKKTNSLFVLSTHLYEIAEELKQHKTISFKYFETAIVNEKIQFSYQLKDGVSNDRLGYLILQQEGVVDMLEKL